MIGDMISFKEMIEQHIQERYDGNAAEFARESGFTPQTISAWKHGKVTLPQLATRRKLAHELGISHLELLLAMGELAPEEVNLPQDPRSDAVRRLTPAIDSFEWTERALRDLEYMIRSIGSMQSGVVDAPRIEEE